VACGGAISLLFFLFAFALNPQAEPSWVPALALKVQPVFFEVKVEPLNLSLFFSDLQACLFKLWLSFQTQADV
jgi:hypothetical protein